MTRLPQSVSIALVVLLVLVSMVRAESREVVTLGPPEPHALILDGHEIVPRFVVEPTAHPDRSGEPSPVFAPLIFAVAGRDQPVLLVREAEGWSVRRFEHLGDWELVAVLGNQHLWAVLDTQWQSSWSPVTLIRSIDGGQHWTLMGTVPKPSNWARVESLRMDAGGLGRLTFALRTSDESLVGESAPAGLYHYRTDDAGKTWSEAELEPDGLRPVATTASHPNAGWDPSTHVHPLWREYVETAPKERRAEFTGITWSDQGSALRVVVHTGLRLQGPGLERPGLEGTGLDRLDHDSNWSHDSLKNPSRELLVIRGLEPVDSQEIPVDSPLLETIRAGFHWQATGFELHVVLDLAQPTVYVRSIQVVDGTDLEIFLALREE